MIESIGRAIILVKDYDEALKFYQDTLGFKVIADIKTEEGMRFLHAGLPQQPGVGLWFIQADEDERDLIGRQTGHEPTLVMYTRDCKKTWKKLKEHGVEFMIEPREDARDLVAHFKDLYGNEIVLVELG